MGCSFSDGAHDMLVDSFSSLVTHSIANEQVFIAWLAFIMANLLLKKYTPKKRGCFSVCIDLLWVLLLGLNTSDVLPRPEDP